MGRRLKNHTYIVKNTFVELRSSEEKHTARRRSMSDTDSAPSPPFTAVAGPVAMEQPDLNTYAMSHFNVKTPSPFLYPALPPFGPDIPPMEFLEPSCNMFYDFMGGFPPVFAGGEGGMFPMEGAEHFNMQMMDSGDAMYDASSLIFMPNAWGPFDAPGFGVPEGLAEEDSTGTVMEHLQKGSMVLDLTRAVAGNSEVACPNSANQGHAAAAPAAPADEGEACTQPPWSGGDEKGAGDDDVPQGGVEKKAAAAGPNKSTDRSGGGGGGGGAPGATTVMLRNIPNKYTRSMLVDQMKVDFKGEIDFLYLPIDFRNRCNVGYAFINFRSVEAMERFVLAYNGVSVTKCLPGLNSHKIAQVTPARVHGLHDNVERLRNSPIMSELADHPEWMPLLLDENGDSVPFPEPEHGLPAMKPRGRRPRNDDEHAGAGASAAAAPVPQLASDQQESIGGRSGGGNARGGRGRHRHSKAERHHDRW